MKPYISGTKAEMRTARLTLRRLLGLPRRAIVVGGPDFLPNVYSPFASGWTGDAVGEVAESADTDEAALFVPDSMDSLLGLAGLPVSSTRKDSSELPMKVQLAIVALALFTACAPSEPVRVFIFAGQSNIFGADSIIDGSTKTRGLVDMGLQTDVDASSILAVAGSGDVTYGWADIRGHDGCFEGEWVTAQGVPYKGHGPEVGFNRALGGNLAILKFTGNYALEGGRSAWARGSAWTTMQAFIDAKLADLGRPYVVEGFLWDQGIDDGIQQRTQAAYAADLRQVITDFRAKFGHAPFVLARSVDSQIAGSPNMAPIRAGQLEVAADPGNAWVNMDDLTPYTRVHHLTAASQLIFGARFAAAWQALDAASVP